MLFWELLVAADLLVTAGYWRAVWRGQERVRGFDFVSVAVGLVGMIGLIIYAFSLPKLLPVFWRIFVPIFIASCAWEIAEVTKEKQLRLETVVGVAPTLLLVGFTSVALYRLGGSHWIGLAGL